jgi:malonyl-CoA O-methyltransferase
MINKEYKRKSFNRAALTYDSYSTLQDIISCNLIDRLKTIKLDPLHILDLGCGTGTNGLNLRRKYKKSRIINYDFSENMLKMARIKQKKIILGGLNPYSYICADIEAIPLEENSLDLVWSSSTLQWCNDLDLVFNQVKKILKPRGLFIFSTFGPNTLNELREITENLFNEKKTSTFIDMNNIGNLLMHSGFINPTLDVENLTVKYKEVEKLFKDIKSIGATNGNVSKNRGLSGRSFTKKIIDNYEAYRENNLLPASYEVIYGHAWNISKSPSEHLPIMSKK